MGIIEIIKGKRKERGIGVGDMSERMKVSRVTYWKMEKGDQEIRVSDLEKIAVILGCKLEIILEDDDKVV